MAKSEPDEQKKCQMKWKQVQNICMMQTLDILLCIIIYIGIEIYKKISHISLANRKKNLICELELLLYS